MWVLIALFAEMGSNHQPSESESDVLPVELSANDGRPKATSREVTSGLPCAKSIRMSRFRSPNLNPSVLPASSQGPNPAPRTRTVLKIFLTEGNLICKSGWRDLNSRPPVPKTGALTKLRHNPLITTPHDVQFSALRACLNRRAREPHRLVCWKEEGCNSHSAILHRHAGRHN